LRKAGKGGGEFVQAPEQEQLSSAAQDEAFASVELC